MFDTLLIANEFGYIAPSDSNLPLTKVGDKTLVVESVKHYLEFLDEKDRDIIAGFSLQENMPFLFNAKGVISNTSSPVTILSSTRSFLTNNASVFDMVKLIKADQKFESYDLVIEDLIRRLGGPRYTVYGPGFIKASIADGELSYRLMSDLTGRILKTYGLTELYDSLHEKFKDKPITWIPVRQF